MNNNTEINKKEDKKEDTKNRKIQIKKWVMVIVIVCVFAVGAVVGVLLTHMSNKDKDAAKSADSNVSFKKDFDPMEYIKLGDYKGMKVSLAVSQDDIQSEIDSLLEEHTTYEELSGVVKNGDTVYAEFEGYVDGKRVDSTCGNDYIHIGSGEWLPGFEDAIIGVKTGDNKKFTLDIPEGTYGDKSVDGKKVEFHVTVKYICGNEIVPEYNNDFVKSISSDCKTTEEYNEYIKEKLTKENKNDRADYAWSDLMNISEVIKYPDDMLEDAKKVVLQGYYDMASIYGKTSDEIFTQFGYESEEDFKEKDLDSMAKDTVKEILMARALAKAENIGYSDADYKEVVDEEYSYNEEKYPNKEKYEEDNRQALKDETLQKAVKAWLKDNIRYTTD